jgi:hypothetical protein
MIQTFRFQRQITNPFQYSSRGNKIYISTYLRAVDYGPVDFGCFRGHSGGLTASTDILAEK